MTVTWCDSVTLGERTQVLLAPKHILGDGSWAHSSASSLLALERLSLPGVTEQVRPACPLTRAEPVVPAFLSELLPAGE